MTTFTDAVGLSGRGEPCGPACPFLACGTCSWQSPQAPSATSPGSVMPLQEVRALAEAAHAGQADAAGRGYAEWHLAPVVAGVAVLGGFSRYHLEAVAWLRGTLSHTEHTGRTGDSLVADGVDGQVVGFVEHLTRRPGESAAEVLDRACVRPLPAAIELVAAMWAIVCLDSGVPVGGDGAAADLLDDRYLPARGRLVEASGVCAADLHAVDLVLRAEVRRLVGAGAPTNPGLDGTYDLR